MHGWMALGLVWMITDCEPDPGSGWVQAEPRPREIIETSVAVLPGPGMRSVGRSLGLGAWQLAKVIHESNQDPMAMMIAAGASYVAPVLIGEDGGPIVPTRDILIGLTGARDDVWQAIGAELAATGLHAQASAPWAAFELYRLRTGSTRGDDVLELAGRIGAIPGVAFAEPDMVFTGGSLYTPNDPYFSQLWGIRNEGQTGGVPGVDMDGDLAWNISIGDASIVTVVIDTGVDQNHPDLHQLPGIDFIGGDREGGPVNECDNHGTPVAGCIAGKIDNNRGIVGIAPGTLVISARTFESSMDCNGSWTTMTSATVDALDFAVVSGARVTNNSNWYGFTSSAIAAAYSASREAGVIHFASAGNNAQRSITYPASLPTVIAVGAINKHGNKASFSNYGPGLFLTAPGVEILTTDRRGMPGWSMGDYVSASGTSFASPYAAGVAALVISVNPTLTVAKIERIMAETATDYGDTGWDEFYGWGQVNAHAAVEAAFAMAKCPYDLAQPYGLLDLSDLVAFVLAFLDDSPIADFAEPEGVFDLMDILLYVSGFHSGCW